MQVKQWNQQFEGAPSEEALRQRFKGQEYRVAKSTYRAPLRFSGVMGPGMCYVLKGACRYAFKDEAATLRAGEFCETPGGDYDFEVVGAGEAIVVKIWHMPTLFARAGIPWPPQGGDAAG